MLEMQFLHWYMPVTNLRVGRCIALVHVLSRQSFENVREFRRNSGWSISAFGERSMQALGHVVDDIAQPGMRRK
jgi:hypothetical protein